MTDDDGRLMGSTEVAALLGVSPATIARAVQAGRLLPSGVTPGGHSRFAVADVQAYRRHGRRRAAGQEKVIRLPELADLPSRIDATIRAKHGIEMREADWRTVMERLDHLADAIVDIIDRPFVQAAAPPTPAPSPTPPPTDVVTTGDSTIFEDGNSGITLIVKPIERFALIESITGLLSSVQGVGEIRLRRLQRGVAWFTVRYAGILPATAILPRALASIGAEVAMTSDRLFEVTLPRSEDLAAAVAAKPSASRSATG